jgi:ornithine cyclodeaminase/alanine dehydrogenase-like protein (mu-crystallin family)
MLILNQSDVERLLPMATCVELMDATFRALANGETILPLRTILKIPTSNAFAVMPGYINTPPTIGAKIITVFPGNHGTAYDSHQGAVLLFDPNNGSLVALLDATSVTTIRTAACSGVATRVLAKKNASSLAILGAGVQGHSHLEAMCAVRPIETLRIWSRNKTHADVLAKIGRDKHGLDAVATETAEEAVRDAEIVCTTTASTEPVLVGDWLAPGAHVNAVGVSQPHAREIDTATVVRSRLFGDRRESVLKEPGDIIIPLSDGDITPDHLIGEIGEVLIGRIVGRRDDSDITLFKSLGLAVEDLASASHVYAEAVRTNAGTRVDLGGARHVAH